MGVEIVSLYVAFRACGPIQICFLANTLPLGERKRGLNLILQEQDSER